MPRPLLWSLLCSFPIVGRTHERPNVRVVSPRPAVVSTTTTPAAPQVPWYQKFLDSFYARTFLAPVLVALGTLLVAGVVLVLVRKLRRRGSYFPLEGREEEHTRSPRIEGPSGQAAQVQQPVHVCVLGNSGDGKSSLLNALAEDPHLFRAAKSLESVTQRTESHTISSSVDGRRVDVCLIDTPGLNDRDNEKREEHVRAVLDGLRDQGHLHLVLIVLDATNPRFHAKAPLMAQIQKEFGSTFWHFTAFVLTHHESQYNPQQEESRRGEIRQEWRRTITQTFPEAAHADLPFFFIDSLAALRTVEEIQAREAEGGVENLGDAAKWDRLKLASKTERAKLLQCANACARTGRAFYTHSLGCPSITGWKLFQHPWIVGKEVVTSKLEVDHAKPGYTSVKIRMSPNLKSWLEFDHATWTLHGTVKYFNVQEAEMEVTVENVTSFGSPLKATAIFAFSECNLKFSEAMCKGYKSAVSRRLRERSFPNQGTKEELRSWFREEALAAVRERASQEQQHDGLAEEQRFWESIDLEEEVQNAVERNLNEQEVGSTPWGCVVLHLRHYFRRYAQAAVALLCIGAVVALLGWQVNLHSCTPSHCKSESLAVQSPAPVCDFLGYPTCSEERCCVEKRCSCKNGVAEEGHSCYRHFGTGDWCESCEPGYDLMLGACKQPWTCQNGKPQAGARTSDEDRCTSCLEGFHLTEQKTCEMDRPWHCLNGEAADGYRTSDALKCRSCNTGFHLTEQQSCEVDRPWLCAHGTPPPGQRSSEEQKCESCRKGYHLVGEVCEEDCHCPNGHGPADCEPPGSSSCIMCETGFHLTEQQTWAGSQLTEQRSCEADRPWLCEHGVPAPGQRSSEEQKCASCDKGYHLAGQVCEQDCSCQNGRGPVKCESPGSNSCTSCDSGFSLVNGMCEDEDFVLTEQAHADKSAHNFWSAALTVVLAIISILAVIAMVIGMICACARKR